MKLIHPHRVSTPKQVRVLLHHAWLHLHLRQSVCHPGEHTDLLESKLRFMERLMDLGVNEDFRLWHRDHCRRCKQILLAHIKESKPMMAVTE